MLERASVNQCLKSLVGVLGVGRSFGTDGVSRSDERPGLDEEWLAELISVTAS